MAGPVRKKQYTITFPNAVSRSSPELQSGVKSDKTGGG